MKKIFLVLLAISMMATMFCACGTPAGEESPAAVDEPNEETAADARQKNQPVMNHSKCLSFFVR